MKIWSILRDGGNPLDDTRISDKVKNILHSSLLQDVHSSYVNNDLLSLTTLSETLSSCGGRKLLLSLHTDNAIIETVLIPTKHRTTVCVSTQIGCDRGCSFCATATMGFSRNLTSDEIVSQVLEAKRIVIRENLPPLTNVVYMGMGDAGRNIEAVKSSVLCLTNPLQMSLPQNRLTVSTVGPSPEIFQTIAELPCNIAWSLHSPDDKIRKFLVPSTKHTTIQLKTGLLNALQNRKSLESRSLMIAFTLVEGINDSIEDAQKIADFALPFLSVCSKLAIDLIPYNDIESKVHLFTRPSDSNIRRFQEHLRKQGYFCMVRLQRGESESSACGMLVTKRIGGKSKGETAVEVSEL